MIGEYAGIHLKGTTYRDSKGIYTWKNERFTSVTTILGALSKPALMYWSAKSVAEYVALTIKQFNNDDLTKDEAVSILSDVESVKQTPWRYRDKRAGEGTQVHACNEMVAAGQVVNPEVFATEVRPYIESFLRWNDLHKPKFHALEMAVFNREHNYAGTGDTIMEVGGRMLLVDYKTSSDSYHDHALQLAAYRHGEFIGLPDGTEYKMPETDGGAILLISPDGARLLEWDCGGYQFDRFLELRNIHGWTKTKPAYKEILTCPS